MTTLFRRHPEQHLRKSHFTRYLQYFRDVAILYSCQAYLWTLLRCLFAFARAFSENSKLVGGKLFYSVFKSTPPGALTHRHHLHNEHHHNLNTLPTTPFTYSCNTHPFYSVFTALSSWGQSGLVNRRLSLGTFAGNCSRLPVRYQPPPPPQKQRMQQG